MKRAVPAFFWPLSLTAVILSLAFGTFQNCSKVNFETALSSSLDDGPIQTGMVTITAGLRRVPDLKMIFVVDNSYTMKANQVNLSQSFGKMFDPSSTKSLAPFGVKSFLVSTAQKTPAYGSSEIAELDQIQLTPAEIEAMLYPDLLATHRSSFNSGALPGDNIGFATSIRSNPTVTEFLPAPVLGAKASGTGRTLLSMGMTKAPAESADAFAAEFQARVALLDNARIPTLADGSQKFSSILDAESGMCAMARMLRNNENFFSAGEMAAFVVVSDEDEADQAGTNCVQRHSTWTGTEDLVRGNCEHRRTVVTYITTKVSPDACKISYQKGYKFKYSWQQMVTSHKYPRTLISYFKKQSTYKLASTLVKYYNVTSTPVYRDGIQVGETAVYSSLQQATREGDYTADCNAFARSISGTAALDDAHKPVCTRTDVSVTSCSATNPNCIITVTYPAASTTVAGTFITGPACTDQIKNVANAVIDGSKSVTCAATSSGTGSGECPSNLIALGCTSTSTSTTANATGSISFANSNDGGATLPKGSCGAIKTAVFNQVRASNSNALSSGTCEITDYDLGSTSPALQADIGCATQATNYCSSNSTTARSCSGQMVAGTTTYPKTSLPAVDEQVVCTQACDSTKVNFCSPAANVTVVPGMTIGDYFKARYGSSTKCETATTVPGRKAFADQLASAKDKICMTSPYNYYVQDGLPYRKTGPQIEHVAGSVTDANGKQIPAMSLPDYIVHRSGDVFGESTPFVSMFVRRSTDPAGTQGSAGVKYESLAAKMGGRTESILAEDFSPALENLSGVIKDRLQRSFTIDQMRSHQKVRRAWMLDANGVTWNELDQSLWVTSGKTITLSDIVDFDLEDKFRFEYW